MKAPGMVLPITDKDYIVTWRCRQTQGDYYLALFHYEKGNPHSLKARMKVHGTSDLESKIIATLSLFQKPINGLELNRYMTEIQQYGGLR